MSSATSSGGTAGEDPRRSGSEADAVATGRPSAVLTCYGRTVFGYAVWEVDGGELHRSSRTDLDRARTASLPRGRALVAGEWLDTPQIEALLDAACNPAGVVLAPCARCAGPATHRTLTGERVCRKHAVACRIRPHPG